MWDYSDTVKDHFFNPRNAGALTDANAVGEVGSLSCGDALKLMLRIDPATGVIEAAGFQTFGCGSAIAASSALTELIIGRTVAEAKRLTNQDIAAYLDGLPPEKMHCSVMGQEALSAALADFAGEDAPGDDHEEGALTCKCFGVDAGLIERAIRTNRLTTLEMVSFYTKAGAGCSSCREPLEELLADTNAAMVAEDVLAAGDAYVFGAGPAPEKPKGFVIPDTLPARRPEPITIAPPPEPPTTGVSAAKEAILVARIFEEMRPTFQRDGGDVELVDIEEARVLVRLTGACAGCLLAGHTLGGLQQKIVETLGRPVRVIPVAKS